MSSETQSGAGSCGEFTKSIIETMPEPCAGIEPDLHILMANHALPGLAVKPEQH